jgi:hypothetical protein
MERGGGVRVQKEKAGDFVGQSATGRTAAAGCQGLQSFAACWHDTDDTVGLWLVCLYSV